ncbi:hypothetical protein [Sphingomonas sp. KR3-1]|uniref:hypothetical protein n=1 Tax=Sphingomonas sp. KR3-1 TaxID=3156611 RepID=UPI0032B5BF55
MMKPLAAALLSAGLLLAGAAQAQSASDLPPNPSFVDTPMSSTYPHFALRKLQDDRAALTREALRLRKADGGTLSGEHLAYLRAKADKLNRQQQMLSTVGGPF